MKGFENIEFPVIYTYKAVGVDNDEFKSSVKTLFVLKDIHGYTERVSSKGNYVSVSVTVEIANIDELKHFYGKIADLPGLKYHL